MYEEFYGFRDHPFRLTPDPAYLFLSANHQEALGHLLFGVKEGSGVVVITGEIGAGKTTLLRTLVRNLDDQTIVAYIFNPALSAIELLQTINTDLGLPASSTSKKELIDDLNRFLLAQQAAGRKVVVIVDEAQDLEPSVLEQLRLLSNLETERAKLLQIMLVGQPELRDILARPELAQLDQRVTLRWHLGSLTKDETIAYVRHRIRVAADGQEPVLFTDSALATIYRFSKGIPRLINIVCHRALLIGYTREERRLDRPIVLQAIQELGRKEPTSTHTMSTRLSSPFLTGMAVALGVFVLIVVLYRNWVSTQAAPAQEAVARTTPQVLEENKSLAPAPSLAPPPAVSTEPPPPTAEKPVDESQATESSSPLSAPTATATEQPEAPSPQSPPSSENLTQLTAAAASAQTLPEDQAFIQELQQATVIESAVQAANNLLRVWEATPLKEEEWRNGAMDLGAIANARRLEYLPASGAFNLLALLDLPAILELTTPEQHEPRFVLLTGVTGNRCRLLLTREYEVPFQLLTEHWFGKAHLFWRDFENVGAALAVGSVGQQVKRLQTLLSQVLGVTTPLPTDVRADTYSRHTEALVARFQKSKRLTPDGIVGPRTMITLYNELPQYAHPTLQKAGTSLQAQTQRKEHPPAPPTSSLQDAQGHQQRNPYEHHS